ncbi:uncharacterized protein LOC144193066 [Stigmatopora nigra]
MLVMSCLMWIFYGSLAVGGPVHHLSWSEAVKPLVRNEALQSPFYHLPVFWHAPQPLVAKELFRPTPTQSSVPSELSALLFPAQTTQYHIAAQEQRTRPVEVWCGSREIVVRVDRFKFRAWPNPALYRLGSCQPTKVSSHFLIFDHALTDPCVSATQVVAGGLLVYSCALYYTPPPQDYIIRVLPFNLPLHCYYNRFHYSYQVGYTPQMQHTTFRKSLRTKLSFSLTVCNAEWEPLSPEHSFALGEPVNFVAQTGSLLPGEMLFVDSCHVTPSKDPISMPKVALITNYGCMTDSERQGSSSYFWSRSDNLLKFSMDAFLLRTGSQVLYLHCSMSVGATTSHTAKSCNYNQSTRRWEELDSPLSTCSCCESICGDKQDSVKAIVSSPVLNTHYLDEEWSNIKPLPPKSVEEEERGQQNLFRESRTLLKVPKPDNKTEEIDDGDKTFPFPYEGEELMSSSVVSMSMKMNESTHTTSDGTIIMKHGTEDVSERGEITLAYSSSNSGLFTANSATPKVVSKNTISVAHNSSIVSSLIPSKNISTDLIPIAKLCSNEKSCQPKNDTVKVKQSNASAGYTSSTPTAAADPIRLEIQAREESPKDKIDFDLQSAKTYSKSSDESGNKQLKRIEEQADFYVNRKGLDEEDQFQHPKTRQPEFRGQACVDGSDCNSGIEGEALKHSQFANAAATESKFSDTLGSLTVQEGVGKSQHTSVMIITSKVHEKSHLIEWPMAEHGLWN